VIERAFEAIAVGDEASRSVDITAALVDAFAGLSSDGPVWCPEHRQGPRS
jgi:hypothetical protein